MEKTRTFHRKKTVLLFFLCFFALCFLGGRLAKLMVAESEYYAALAGDQGGAGEDSGRQRSGTGGQQDRVYDFCDSQSDHGSGEGH